ncbi:peptide N-acetyl-beta-D-glucosaminyl asparaginase amidase A-domain-containing protein [Geopyxis carbonaria]|nr:peptide N-acetyl-beta-D-glucosaminyl asparaginase amidase A-domain-containing protein [Geopyxis carbonaria]
MYAHLASPAASGPCPAPPATADAPPPLDVFQVSTPPLHLPATPSCTQPLLNHTFAFSYGRPYIGLYTPPPSSCVWTRALLRLTLRSAGRQFDRLAHIYFGDVEVWRTSTPEPTWYGVRSEHVKEVTHLAALLRREQRVVVELGNLVNEVYNGTWEMGVGVEYYNDGDLAEGVEGGADGGEEEMGQGPADEVWPISAMRSSRGEPSHWRLPSDTAATNVTLPRNTLKAAITILASGNAAEEFWYTNVPSPYTHTFPSTTLPGHSSFREIQLLLDGQLVGAVWPFATIFTGGIVPSLWRPVVGMTAFDLPEYSVDISPHLPRLLDGRPHTVSLHIRTFAPSASGDGGALSDALGSDWIVSARLHLWRDASPGWHTTGRLHQALAPPPRFSHAARLTATKAGVNETLSLSLAASRNLAFVATLETSRGPRAVSWIQGLHYDAATTLSDGGGTQVLRVNTAGSENTLHAGSRHWRWPLALVSNYEALEDGGAKVEAQVRVGVSKEEVGAGMGGKGRRMGAQLRGVGRWRSGEGGWGRTGVVWADVVAGVGSWARRVEAEADRVVGDWREVDGVKQGVEEAGADEGAAVDWEGVLSGEFGGL